MIGAFQPHSTTSQQGWENARPRVGVQSQRMLDILRAAGDRGKTGMELSEEMGIVPGTVSARLARLLEDGVVIKTALERGRVKGNVHVAREHWLPLVMGQVGKKSYANDINYRRAVEILTFYSRGHWDNGESALKFLGSLGGKQDESDKI